MKGEEIFDKLVDIVEAQFGGTRETEGLRYSGKVVTRDSSLLDDLGADSLDNVEMLMEVEDAFDLSIPDEDAEKWKTLGDIVEYVEEQLKK